MSKGRWIAYSPSELGWIEEHHKDDRKEMFAAFQARFNRPDVSFQNIFALCKRKGWLTGRYGRFVKGGPSLWTGRKRPPHPNSDACQFKKGLIPHNTRPMWSERVDRDGYIEMKVPVRNPFTGHSTRYMHKHRYLWEQVNGPLPKGMCLKSVDGNRRNTDPANWIAVPRAFLPRLNGHFGRDYDSAPSELKPVILAIAKLEHKAREKRKAGRNDGGSRDRRP